MTYLQALILGIIQGVTEFLPISSSGHLVIVPFLLGWTLPEEQVFPFDVLVQFSTLFAVLIYYRKDIIQIIKAVIIGIRAKKPFSSVESRVGWLTVLATIPAGIAGILLKDIISNAFSNPRLAAVALIITGVTLFISDKKGKQNRNLKHLNWKDASVMGFAQALAVFPGISRSGSTISGGLLRGLDRKTTGQFSFLMAIPIMSAAGVLSLIDLLSMPSTDGFLGILAIGFITSGVVGFFSIKWLLEYISKNDLTPFAIYCMVIGIGTLAISYISFPIENQQQASADDLPPSIIAYQTSTTWMIHSMQKCIDDSSDINGILLVKSDALQIPEDASFFITFGELDDQTPHTYQLGSDTISGAASTNNPISVIPTTTLEQILTGKIAAYRELLDACPDCMSTENASASISLWMYPEGSPMSDLILDSLNISFSSQSAIAPSPNHMVQMLKADPTAIGILPDNLIDNDLKSISPTLSQPIPILAHGIEEPNAIETEWLSCLQREIMQ